MDRGWLIVLGGLGVLVLLRQQAPAALAPGVVAPGSGAALDESGNLIPASLAPGGVTAAPSASGAVATLAPAYATPATPTYTPTTPTYSTPAPTAAPVIAPAPDYSLLFAPDGSPLEGYLKDGLTVVKIGAPFVLPTEGLAVGESFGSEMVGVYPAIDSGEWLAGTVSGVPGSEIATAAIGDGSLEVTQLGSGAVESVLLDLGTFLTVVGVVALLVDIGFVIAGDAPNALKAVNVALDAVALVCLFVPVYGWIIAIVVELVKFIINLFWKPKLTHAQREAIEAARYAEHLHPIFPQLVDSYSPREVLRVLIEWGSGMCGGKHDVAIITGLHNTPAAGFDLYFGDGAATWAGGACGAYYGPNGMAGTLDFDAQAMALATRGQTEDFFALAQAGIVEDKKATINAKVFNLVTTRCEPFAQMAARGLTLDQMDGVAAEYRRTEGLNKFSAIFGFDKWQDMFARTLQPYWTVYIAAHPTEGSLDDFAQTLGYENAIALREAVFAPYRALAERIQALETRLGGLASQIRHQFGEVFGV
jgi:hypothetical protein